MSQGDEAVPFRTLANLWREAEAVGGQLTITSTQLEFRAHTVNFQRSPVSLPIQGIAKVEKVRTMGLIPNGLVVTTTSGDEYRFVVGKRNKIIQLLGRS